MKKLFVVVLFSLACSIHALSQQSDAELRSVIEKDKASRDGNGGRLPRLSTAENLSRGSVYFTNRQFPEAREHLQQIIENYPSDAGISSALLMVGRANMWERKYADAIPYFDRVSREFPGTKDGREGLAFKGACNIRLGKNAEAAKIYEQYTTMYPAGERIDSAYLNIIDALRGAGKYDEAAAWVAKTRERFPGQPTETNAMQARLRMEIFRGRWADAEKTADTMLSQVKFAGSMTSADEIKYLKAFALEREGKRGEALGVYSAIPDSVSSYYSGLAVDRLVATGSRVKRTTQITAKITQDFPAAFRSDVLRYSKPKKIDPRFVLALMKQESAFRPGVKSPAAARGLLQLTMDLALKYNQKAGFPVIQADDLYQPRINIAIGCEYIAALRDQFGGLNEAIAASYNGGEDNVARWLNRSKPKEAAIFTSEIGFAETKNYVSKVMTSYRIYRDLYDENLNGK